MPSKRLQRVVGDTERALLAMPRCDAWGAISTALGARYRVDLESDERALLLGASVQAADPDHLEQMSHILARWYYREGVWR